MKTGSNEYEEESAKLKQQALSRLRGAVTKKKFCTFDLEATQWVNIYAAGFFDGEEYQDFFGADCVDQLLLAVLTPEYARQWIYAHNGGNYDLLFLIRRLITSPIFMGKYLVDIIPIGSSILKVEVSTRGTASKVKRSEKGKLKWTFVDSIKLLPIGLNKLGETFGLGSKEDRGGLTFDQLALPENRHVVKKYLEQDCRLLWNCVDKMQNTINNMGGEIGITLPTTAIDLFRRSFQSKDIMVNRHFLSCPQHGHQIKRGEKPADGECSGCMHDFIREGYYGGRTEIFRMEFKPSHGHDEIKVYDINSHYPHCMLEAMPIGPGCEIENITEAQVYQFNKRMMGIVECEVYIPPDCYLPPLPYRMDGKLTFPVGTFRGTWDAAELVLLAEVGGKILKTYKSVWFETAFIFNDFIETLYRYRDKKRDGWTGGMDFIAKILMNSAYGRFAMREERERIVVNPGLVEGLVCMDLESDIWRESIFIAPNYIVPQISTHITAIARVRLWRFLNAVVNDGGRIYYADTDSVFVSGVTLPTSHGLGGLKLESIVTRASFVLPKFYLIQTKETNDKKLKEKNIKIKAKGMGPGIKIPQNAEPDPYDGQLSELDFRNLAMEGFTLNRFRLTKLKEGLREATKAGCSFPRVTASPKSIRSKYDKRLVLDDYNTSPFVLSCTRERIVPTH